MFSDIRLAMSQHNPHIWIAVYTRPRWEKAVDAQLRASGIESYVPIQRQLRQWSDRRKIIEVPLLPSYVLVHLPLDQHRRVYQAAGVVRVVMFHGRVAVIQQSEIDLLKRIERGNDSAAISSMPVRTNDQVQIIAGPFEGYCGNVVRSDGGCRVALEIEQLSCAVLVEVPCNWVIRKTKSLRQVA
jgi:transcriptional antiterminator RfaH